jgi:2-dehydropantoate 2-reductase
MKIAVVGAGAMGSLFGASLAEAGFDVALLDVWADHVHAVNANGLDIERDGVTRSVSIRADTEPNRIGPTDLVIVFVKSTHTSVAAQTAARLADVDGLVLTLQNGLGNADVIAEAIDPERVLAGTTAHGATLLGPGRIRHAGVGPTVMGMWAGGDSAPARRVAEVFNRAGLETRVAEDVRPVVWDKLLVNVGINAITALTGTKNGQLLDLESTRELCRAAIDEAMTVARNLGIRIRDDAVQHVFQVAEATGPNRSSMGQDVDNHRLTEIRAINGAVVREAHKVGVDTPVNRTLTALVATLEAHYPSSQNA